LVHADTLKQMAAEAERAEKEGNLARAVAAWRGALELLPQESGQYRRIFEKVGALSTAVPAMLDRAPEAAVVTEPSTVDRKTGRYKWAAGAGAVGLFLAKFKWALLFLFGKGKILLAGLLKAKTFLSMAVSLGVYASAFGWRFALGLVLSIYVHEMGHVVWLRHYGIPATAPMFIPGLGAFVRMHQRPATVGQDARVGLAGPVWGAAAAVFALVLGSALDLPILVAIAKAGAWINLFNLLPIWQLDGGRGFSALSQRQRTMIAAVLWVLALSVGDGVFFLLAVAASFRAAGKDATAPATGDRSVLATYLALVVGFALLIAATGHVAP
jgi:Zn-dependent protease